MTVTFSGVTYSLPSDVGPRSREALRLAAQSFAGSVKKSHGVNRLRVAAELPEGGLKLGERPRVGRTVEAYTQEVELVNVRMRAYTVGIDMVEVFLQQGTCDIVANTGRSIDDLVVSIERSSWPL